MTTLEALKVFGVFPERDNGRSAESYKIFSSALSACRAIALSFSKDDGWRLGEISLTFPEISGNTACSFYLNKIAI
jgi:hypothetical protein